LKETLDKVGLKRAKTGEVNTEETTPEKQDETLNTRNADGTFKKGHTGNPNGRPKAGSTVVDQFRDNPKVYSVIEKLFKVADTLGSDNPDKDALSASKLIIERIIPSLKSSDLQIETTEKGYVVLPEPEEDDE
jgi:hypothetical protein